MDDFLQLVASRQSDRAYDMSRAVEHDKLERILEAARLSPSACALADHCAVEDEVARLVMPSPGVLWWLPIRSLL